MKRGPIVGWIALATLNCAVIVPWLSRHWPPPHDFGMFYTAVYVYRHDAPAKLYDFDPQLQTQKQLYGSPDGQALLTALTAKGSARHRT